MTDKRKRGRPERWNQDMVLAAVHLIRRYGAKRAAAMCGVTYNGLRMSLASRGVGIKAIRGAP